MGFRLKFRLVLSRLGGNLLLFPIGQVLRRGKMYRGIPGEESGLNYFASESDSLWRSVGGNRSFCCWG